MNSRVKLAAIGLGNRTCKYLRYVAEHPDLVELVAAVDTDSSRFANVLDTFDLSEKHCFDTIDAMAESGLEIDACIIGTPDKHHHEMAVKAMRYGWHILLEKPMGQTPMQCDEIVQISKETGKMVSVCYVLRYHPYFIKLKELTERPEFGRIRSVNHIERVGKDRMTHTFIRGPWNKAEMNTSVFFTKCCHDVDFVLWLIGEDVVSVNSAHGPRIFEESRCDAADRCIECPIEKECPYSAVDLYLRRKDWIKGFTRLSGETQEETIYRMLKESRYGRCVYKCPEHDGVEFQSVELNMSSGIRAEITMECNTEDTARLTTIDCENAMIFGDECTITVEFKDKTTAEAYDFSWARSMNLHAGADLMIIEEFINAIQEGHLQTRTSGTTPFLSHKICFMAEKD